MSQRRKARVRKEDKCPALHCNLCNETYTSRKVKNKLSVCLTKQNPSKKEKTIKNLQEKKASKKTKKSKSTEKCHFASDKPVCNSSPSSSDKISDSDLIIISEADSNLSEKVSPSSGYSGSSPCNDSIFKLNTDNVCTEVSVKSTSLPLKSKCNISVSLNEYIFDSIENDKILPYESSFAATLPNIEVNYESDFSDLIETCKIQNVMENKSQKIIPEHYNSLQDITVPSHLSPKKNFLSMMSNFNSGCGFKENVIFNQLKIEPVTKPSNFNYEENNFVDFAVDISMLRAASNYIKERSKSQNISVSLPDAGESAWQNSVVRLSDMLNLNESFLNQFSSEDNESEISISSCKTSDIQPEFFDSTFSENILESFPEKNLSDFLNLSSSLTTDTNNDVCSISQNKEMADNVGLLDSCNILSEMNSTNVLTDTNSSTVLSETNNSTVLSETNNSTVLSETNGTNILPETNSTNILPETKPKVKRKRKRCIWDTKKRRCKQKTKKKDSASKLNNEINAENAFPKLNSELNAEAFCDTCDESEAEDGETNLEFLNPSSPQDKRNSSELNTACNNNQNIMKDSEKDEESCNQLVKSSDARQFQNAHCAKENSCIIENLYPKKSDEKQALKESEDPSTVRNEEFGLDSHEVKRKRRRCIWDTKKRRCKKRTKKKDSDSKLHSEFNAEAFCDTCDENEAEDDETNLEFLNLNSLQEKKNSSELNTTCNSNQSITKDSEENEESCTKLIKSCDVKQFQSTHCVKENSCIIENLYPKKSDKNQTLKESEDPSIVRNEEFGLDSHEDRCDSFKKLKNCSLPTTMSIPNQNVNISLKPKKRKRKEDNHPENKEKSSFEPCETSHKSTSPCKTHSPESKKQKLQKSDLQDIKKLKCSSDLNLLSKSHEISIKSNHSLENNLESAVPTDESTETTSDIHDVINSNLLIKVQRLDDSILQKYCEEIGTSEFSRNKSDFKSVCHESPEIISNVCDNFIHEQNSALISDTTLSSEPMHSVLNNAKDNSFNLISDIQENSNKLTEDNFLNNTANMVVDIEDCDNMKKITYAENISSEMSAVEYFSTKSPYSSSEHLLNDNISEIVPENTNSPLDDNTSIFSKNNLDSEGKNLVQEKEHILINAQPSERKSSDNIEPIIFGLIEDDLDFEEDQQEDLQNEDADSDTSVSKFYSDQQNFIEPYSYPVIQDHLSETDCKRNTVDSSVNNEENLFSISNALHESSNFPEQEAYFSYDEDSDDSDKDYNFKRSHERKSNLSKEPFKNESLARNPEENYLPVSSNNLLPVTGKHHEPSLSVCDQSNYDLENDVARNSTNPTKVSPEASLHLTDVVDQIKEYCAKEMGIEAVQVAHTYISISSSTDVNKLLFKKLLSGLFLMATNLTNSEISLCDIFDDVLKLMHKFEIYDKKLLSFFIMKCYELPKLCSHIKEIFDSCLKKNLPLKSEAINAFISVLKTEELDISNLLDYIIYIKSVCKKKIPKNLMHSALEISKTGKTAEQNKSNIYNGMHHMCNILKDTTPKEVNELNLKEFLQACFKKCMYANIAEMFMIWGTKNDLSTCIYLALACESELMAMYYGKLADAIHYDTNEALHPEQKIMFGQIGIALMLEAFTRKYMDCALEILNILHKYNVNYYELGLSFCKFYLLQSSSDVDIIDVKIQPFLVVFVAVDICLHFRRPKDAFYIFQDFLWVTPNENSDEEVKMYVLKERYHRLIKLVPLLNEKDSLHQGWEALKILLTAVEQDLVEETLEETNKGCTEKKSEKSPDCTKGSSETLDASNQTKEKTSIQRIREIYNEYLISLINANELSSAFDLYQHSFGQKKNIFTVKPAILRGLVVAFFNAGKCEFARSVFMHGIFTDVYPIKKPEISSALDLTAQNAPWNLTIRSEWMVPEIKFVVEWFINMLSPLLSDKPKEMLFEKWFSFKIVFKISSLSDSKLTCLVEPGLDPKYYVNKTKFALQSMSPSLQYTDAINEEAIIVTSDSLYNYWKSNCCSDSPTISNFKISPFRQRHKRFSFGEFNASSEKESTLLNEKSCLQTPNGQTNLAEYLVSEYLDEIRSTSSAGTLVPVSPKANPNQMHQNIPNVSPMTNFISEKETSFAYTNVKDSPKKLSDSIIQISKPSRSIDVFNKEYEIQRGKSSLVAHNSINRSESVTNRNKSPSISSVSKNSNVKSKLNVSTVSSSTPKLKNKVCIRTVSKKRIKKLKNAKVILNNSKVNSSTEKLNGDKDINLTVCFTANSSTRIVSNSSKKLETVSDNLQKSKLLTKKNLNKSNIVLNKTTNKISSKKAATNISSNLLVKVPVSNLNASKTEQVQKEPFIVSINEVPREKTTSIVIPQSKISETISNIPQCKVSEPAIQRTINLMPREKTTSTVIPQSKISGTIVSNISQCKVSEPAIQRTINLIPREKTTSTVIPQSKDSESIISNISPCKVSEPAIQRTINLIPREKTTSTVIPQSKDSESIISNISPCKVSEPAIQRTINLIPREKTTSTVIPQSKISETVISNISPCKVSEPAIQRTINLKCQDSGPNKKIFSNIMPPDKGNTVSNNSSQYRVSKPPFKSINLTGHQNKESNVILPTKKCINKNMNYQEDNKTKVHITSTNAPSSHAKDSLVSFPQKNLVNIKTIKLTEQKLDINKTEAPMSFSGNNCHPEEFQRIVNFLRSKVALKNKNLSTKEQQQKALILAETFIKSNNSITKLDKRTMKMLDEFEKANV